MNWYDDGRKFRDVVIRPLDHKAYSYVTWTINLCGLNFLDLRFNLHGLWLDYRFRWFWDSFFLNDGFNFLFVQLGLALVFENPVTVLRELRWNVCEHDNVNQ